jgi:glyoxylase-like metal-dependent hydrolase (beta-lactamase superfamily II)
VVKHSPTFLAIPLGTVRQVADGQKITVGSMYWEVVWTPGHSPGHICLLERRRGLILTGDHVLPHDTPNIHAHPELPPNPLGRYLDSLRRVEQLPVHRALPGHGKIIDDFQSVVSFLISHHDIRFADVVESLKSGLKSSYDVACEIPWVSRRKYFSQLTHVERWMALGETIAHLQALYDQGRIKPISRNGGIAWEVRVDQANQIKIV